MLRETRVFSQLHHENIVNYHSSWLEFKLGKEHELVDDGDEVVDDDEDYYGNDDPFESNQQSDDRKELVTKKKIIISEPSTSESSSSNASTNQGLFQKQCSRVSSFTESIRSHNPISSNENFGIVAEVNSSNEDASISNKNFVTKKQVIRKQMSQSNIIVLYIQMKLCDCTLRNWLTDRNVRFHDVNNNNHLDGMQVDTSLNIFRQILHGVDYIHSKLIIHRDLKVSNSFLIFKF